MNKWILAIAVLALLVIGTFIGWNIKPGPVITTDSTVVPVTVNFDTSSILNPVTAHLRDSLSTVARSIANRFKGRICLIDSQYKRLLDSLSLSSNIFVDVYDFDTSVIRGVRVAVGDSTIQSSAKINSSVTFIGDPINRFTSFSVQVEPIKFDLNRYKTTVTREIPAENYGFWVQGMAGYNLFGASVGYSHLGIGAITGGDTRYFVSYQVH